MRRLIVALGALALVVGIGVIAPQGTLATWNDNTHNNGQFAAKTVPAPTITGCTVTNNGLGVFQSVTVTFTMPSGYTKTNTVVGMSATTTMAVASPQPTIAGTANPYSVTYSSGLLGSILASLFGSDAYLSVRTADGTWNSVWAPTYKLHIGLLGLGSTCALA